MKFCIVEVHDLTNNISYTCVMWIWIGPKFAISWGKIVKIMCKNCEKLENIRSIYISWYIGIKFCTIVVHMLNKDISYDTKLNTSKISHYGVKHSNSVTKCSSFIWMDPRFLSTV